MQFLRVKFGDYLTTLTDYHANGSYEKLRSNVTLLDDPDFAVMIRTTNFENNDFIDNLKYISQHAYNFLAKSKVYPGDILMNKIASPGSAFRMPDLGRPVSLAMNLFLIRTDVTRFDQTYAYYWLKANEPYVKSFACGAATATITKKAVRELELALPKLHVQRQVANILVSYDELIENNHRRIRILEEMARTLYREWFVKFKFPGHEKVKMVSSPLGEIPEGWEEVPLSSLVQFKSGYPFKSEVFTSNGEYRLITIKNVQDGVFNPDSDSLIDDLPSNLPPYCLLEDGDILLSLTGNIGRVCLVYDGPFLLNQRVSKLVPVDSVDCAFIYCVFRDQDMRAKLEQISNGVAQQNLSPVLASEMRFALPPRKLREQFAHLANPMLESMLSHFKRNQMLRRTRDLLLPRLMSGQIELKET